MYFLLPKKPGRSSASCEYVSIKRNDNLHLVHSIALLYLLMDAVRNELGVSLMSFHCDFFFVFVFLRELILEPRFPKIHRSTVLKEEATGIQSICQILGDEGLCS